MNRQKLWWVSKSLLNGKPAYCYPFWAAFEKCTSGMAEGERCNLKLRIESGEKVVVGEQSFQLVFDEF